MERVRPPCDADGEREGGHQGLQREGAEAGADAQQHGRGVVAEHVDDRQPLLLRRDGGDDFLLEQGRLGDLEPDVEADADEDGAEQERDPPAPGQERLARAAG